MTQWGGSRRGDHTGLRALNSRFVGGHLEVVLLGIDGQLGVLSKVGTEDGTIRKKGFVVVEGRAGGLGVIDGVVDDKDAVEGFDGREEADFSKGLGLCAEDVEGGLFEMVGFEVCESEGVCGGSGGCGCVDHVE